MDAAVGRLQYSVAYPIFEEWKRLRINESNNHGLGGKLRPFRL